LCRELESYLSAFDAFGYPNDFSGRGYYEEKSEKYEL
jgi:hypothetical protein